MVLHRVLDEIFSTWSHIAVLRALQDTAHPLSGREVARVAGMSHRSSLRALTALEGLHLVSRLRGGRDHLFAINREHYLVKEALLPLLEQERRFLGELIGFMKPKLANVAVSVILFGSVVRREETVTSDLDLCIVVRDSRGKKRAQEAVHAMAVECQRGFGVHLAPVFFTDKQFRRYNRSRRSPVPEIVREGRTIVGSPVTRLAHAQD